MKRSIMIVLTLFVVGCATVPITGRRQLSFIPAAELTNLSATQFDELRTKETLITGGSQTKTVAAVGQRIADAAEEFMRTNGMESFIDNYKWEFILVADDTQANAFCMPGGKIVVYTGILPVTQDEEGLAVVIGHEVAHAIANHGGERLSQTLLIQMGERSLAHAMEKKPAETKQILMTAYGAGAQLGLLLPYSRTHEYEADHIGLVLMALAGYDLHAAPHFWERMSKASRGAPPEFLSTHPATKNRIDNIEKLIPEAMTYKKDQLLFRTKKVLLNDL